MSSVSRGFCGGSFWFSLILCDCRGGDFRVFVKVGYASGSIFLIYYPNWFLFYVFLSWHNILNSKCTNSLRLESNYVNSLKGVSVWIISHGSLCQLHVVNFVLWLLNETLWWILFFIGLPCRQAVRSIEVIQSYRTSKIHLLDFKLNKLN